MADIIPNSDKINDTIARSYKESTIVAVFGHSYSQQAKDGIDNTYYSTTITLSPLTLLELVTTIDFLNTLGGSLPFLVPVLGEPNMVVVSTGYTQTTRGKDKYSLSISLKEHKFPGVTP
jgi:phage-related protein